jgi:uncharacterized protein YkwD
LHPDEQDALATLFLSSSVFLFMTRFLKPLVFVAIVLFLTACVEQTESSSGSANDGIVNIGSTHPDPGPSPPQVTGLDAEETAFVTLINQYRAQNGRAPLQVSVALTASSKWMSVDMATKDYFSHTDSLSRDPFARMAAFSYTYSGYSGENIAAGNASAEDTFTQWKNSPGHNANMLESSYNVIGVGRAYAATSSYGWYWTTDFGSFVDATF